MKTVFVYYDEQAQAIAYASYAADTKTYVAETAVSLAALLGMISFSDQVYLIVDGLSVITIQKKFPLMPRHQLLKLLPFSLEEQLLEPIDAYHFSLSTVLPDGTVSCVAVLKEKMKAWLAPFEGQIPFIALLPEYALLPYVQDACTLVLADKAYFRYGEAEGMATDLANWPFFLSLLSAETEPKTCLLYREEDHQEHVDTTGYTFRFAIEHVSFEVTPDEVLIPKWIKAALKAPETLALSLNVLTGDFSLIDQRHDLKREAVWAGLALGMTALLFVFSCLIQWGVFIYRDHHIQAAINTLYAQVYPQATAVVAPKTRLTQTLNSLREGTNQSTGYLSLLYLMGTALHQHEQVRLMHIRYDGKQLTVNLQADHFADLDQLMAALKPIAKVTQVEATQSDNQVNAQWVIEEKK